MVGGSPSCGESVANTLLALCNAIATGPNIATIALGGFTGNAIVMDRGHSQYDGSLRQLVTQRLDREIPTSLSKGLTYPKNASRSTVSESVGGIATWLSHVFGNHTEESAHNLRDLKCDLGFRHQRRPGFL